MLHFYMSNLYNTQNRQDSIFFISIHELFTYSITLPVSINILEVVSYSCNSLPFDLSLLLIHKPEGLPHIFDHNRKIIYIYGNIYMYLRVTKLFTKKWCAQFQYRNNFYNYGKSLLITKKEAHHIDKLLHNIKQLKDNKIKLKRTNHVFA